MDGVLVDLVGGLCREKKIPNPYVHDQDLRGSSAWDLSHATGIDSRDLWGGLDRCFWASLDRTHECGEIFRTVLSYFGKENICFLSAPTREIGCMDGKRRWLREWFPGYEDQFLFGSRKSFVAGPDAVLIDDHQENVESFIEHGGHAFLVPRPWNDNWWLQSGLVNELHDFLMGLDR